ncbi:hypothetical protein QF037_002340 [Streptomyces canus]|nr:hypothetical protein [Streptomyces canus]
MRPTEEAEPPSCDGGTGGRLPLREIRYGSGEFRPDSTGAEARPVPASRISRPTSAPGTTGSADRRRRCGRCRWSACRPGRRPEAVPECRAGRTRRGRMHRRASAPGHRTVPPVYAVEGAAGDAARGRGQVGGCRGGSPGHQPGTRGSTRGFRTRRRRPVGKPYEQHMPPAETGGTRPRADRPARAAPERTPAPAVPGSARPRPGLRSARARAVRPRSGEPQPWPNTWSLMIRHDWRVPDGAWIP